jgi:hypothetical protein
MTEKVYFTIFAGRERYLTILLPYLDVCLAMGIIHEVHLWDFTHNESDAQFLTNMCKTPQYKLMHVKNKKRWDEYYIHYHQCLQPNEIIVKCDDDIVYIDIPHFASFLTQLTDDCLHFPNIVNNDVCAYLQQYHYGIHTLFSTRNRIDENSIGHNSPASDWFLRFEKAAAIHMDFLKRPSKYHLSDKPLFSYGNRISINFFAARQCAFKEFVDVFIETNARINETGYDEEILTGYACGQLNRKNKINPNFTVVHFQFGPQNGKLLDELFLPIYRRYAKHCIACIV